MNEVKHVDGGTQVLGAGGQEALAGAAAAAELREQLEQALIRSGLQVKQLAQRSRLSRTTIWAALNQSENIPSPRTISDLAEALRIDPEPLLALRRLATGRTSARGPGHPIASWGALDLEVHLAGEPGVRDAQPVLSAYVRRAHDLRLSKTIQAVVEGRSAMAVLVGESSTGKTRSCFEAVQPLAAHGWTLWHPFDPTPAAALLAGLPMVEPRTVIWLNEAQRYFDAGEEVASALHALLSDQARAPVLVLGTLWSELDNDYRSWPRAQRTDLHAHTRELLAGRCITVPHKFSPDEVLEAQGLAAAGDSLLADVLGRDHFGRVAQHLAGAPDLLLRYETATLAEQALLHVAMDAWRLGAVSHVTTTFLIDAAKGYLEREGLEPPQPGELEHAAAKLAEPVRAGLAPLGRVFPTRERPSPREMSARDRWTDESEPGYRLADVLDEHGRRHRKALCPPPSFWEAATAHFHDPVCLRWLGHAAYDRRRLQWAQALYSSAAEGGDAEALIEIVEILERSGDGVEAARLAADAADQGRTGALLRLANLREQSGLNTDADAFVDYAASAGDTSGLFYLAMWRRGRSENAEGASPEQLLQRAANAGSPDAQAWLASESERAGDDDEAERLYRLAAAGGSTSARMNLALLWERSGSRADAENLARNVDSVTGREIFVRLAFERIKADVGSNVEDLLQNALACGKNDAWAALTEMLLKAEELESAERCARLAAETGYPDALVRLATEYSKVGRDAEADSLLRQAGDYGHADALVRLALTRDEAGLHEEAERLAQLAADAGSTEAFAQLAIRREEAGAHQEAECFARRADDEGATVFDLAELREDAGDAEAAASLFAEAAELGDASALVRLIELRMRSGDRVGADALRRLALDRRDVNALLSLTVISEGVGERLEAERFALRVADTGVAFALYRLVQMRKRAGDVDGARRLLHLGLDTGDVMSLSGFVNGVMEDDGRRIKLPFSIFGRELEAIRDEGTPYYLTA